MSTEISLFGLVSETMFQNEVRVADFQHEMGFSGLCDTLDYVAGNQAGLLQEHQTEVAGFRQFLVLDQSGLRNHIKAHPEIWDSVGMGFEAGIDLMTKRPDLIWWFHLNF